MKVCNAGIAGRHSKSLLETTEEDWDAIMAVNLRGVFLGCKRAVAEMLAQDPIGEVRGRVVVISSQHGMIGPPGHVALRREQGWGREPRPSAGGRLRSRGRARECGRAREDPHRNPDGARPELLEYSHSRTPFHRLGRPDDVAGAALFLASDDAGYVSGINLLVDGGWMAY